MIIKCFCWLTNQLVNHAANDDPICSSASSVLAPSFPLSVLSGKYWNVAPRPARYTSPRTLVAEGDGERHAAYCLCEAMLWHTLYLDTHMQPTSLSWAFDLLRNMSRTFRGQIARHKQRKCNANKPFSRCSRALWSNTFRLFACFFSSSFEVKNLGRTLAADSFLSARRHSGWGWMRTGAAD